MKLGLIGMGNMASAIIGGVTASGLIPNGQIIAFDILPQAREQAREKWGIGLARDNREVAAQCEIVVLAVKPPYYSSVIKEIAPDVNGDTLVVAIAPGFTLDGLLDMFGKDVKIIRAMPNTPAMVREGMTALCANAQVPQEELDSVLALFGSFGKSVAVPESMMDAVVAVSGSSPAYVYILIEAMADSAVRDGMPRSLAYTFAAQAVLGSARMVLETGLHPGALKDMVCSPAGTTIEAVRVLEEKGFRSSVMEAMRACSDRVKELSALKK